MATSEETDGSTHGHSRILKPAPREGHVILHIRKHLQKHTEQEGHCFPPKNQSRKFLCKPEVLTTGKSKISVGRNETDKKINFILSVREKRQENYKTDRKMVNILSVCH